MTDIDQLEQDVAGLKRLLSLAWSDLAGTSLSTHERREMRNEMTRLSRDLRDRLDALDLAIRQQQSEAEKRLAARRRPATPLRLLRAA